MRESIHSERNKKLRELLKQARKAKGLRQDDLSLKLGKFKTFINKMENGERRLDAMEFLDLVRELEVDVGELIAAHSVTGFDVG